MANPRPVLTIRRNGISVLDRRAPNITRAITLANRWLIDNGLTGPDVTQALEATWRRDHGTLTHPDQGRIDIHLT